MSWIWGPATNPQYEELVEKACSPLNLPYPQSEDISVNLEITDLIRSKAVQPKPAMQSLKRRVQSKNARVQMYALSLIDTCIKNGGDHFLAEIASKEFVDAMSAEIKSTLTSNESKQMFLQLFQSWALGFQSKESLSFFVDVYKELKNSGIQFPPPTQVNAALLSTTTAPTWIDSDVCMRCRTAFTFTNRKHHCRNCGKVFDQACSSKSTPLPHFGITEPVRVCDSCYSQLGKNRAPAGPAPAVPGKTPRTRADYDADLQRAIQLSLAESSGAGSSSAGLGSEPPLRSGQTAQDDDEELRLAIEASLRDMERARPSAPAGMEEPEYRPLPTFDLNPRETETILTFSNTLDQMAAYGERDLRRFPQAHVLYEQAYALGGKLHRNMEEKVTKQQMLHEMQAKLTEAVSLYGQILNGQQAYNARRLQEQQQRQYQNAYNPYPQQQAYNPYAAYAPQYAQQPNGYATYAPQAAYQPQPPQATPSQGPAAPSLYPSMPDMQQPQIYAPVQQQAPLQSQVYQPSPYDQSYAAQAPPPPQEASSQPYHPGLERHASMTQASAPSHPAGLQRNASMSYGSQASAPMTIADSSTPTPVPDAPSLAGASAPPVDMQTHPTASPTSTISALPPHALGNSYQATPQLAPQNHAAAQQQQQQHMGYDHQAYQQQPTPQPQHQHPQQQQQHQQQEQQQPAQGQPHVYSSASFPAAPAAVFPDAPSAEPRGLEKHEQEEVLLIEL